MRILALYDIHGNPDGLDAVLADPRAAGPDAVVVDGDAVPGRSPRPRSSGWTRSAPRSTGSAATASAGRGGRRRARSGAGRDSLPRSAGRRRWTRLSSAERWEETLDGAGAALVVGGHTHQQDDRRVAGVRFVNAGSVGLPYEGDGAARWLWIADGEPELRRTAYDAAGAGQRMLAAGWPDERSVGAALIDPVEPIVVTRIFESLPR